MSLIMNIHTKLTGFNIMNLFCIFFVFSLSNVHGVSTLNTNITEVDIEDLVANFKLEIDSHIDTVLATEKVKQMLEAHERDLVIAPIDGAEIFETLYQTVSVNYNDAVLAVRKLKAAFEANKSASSDHGAPPGPPGIAPPIIQPSMRSCCTLGPGLFSARVRDNVGEEECYGNQDKVLEHISKTTFKDAMKENYQNYPMIRWQYFADSDGRYIQYPANGRTCDRTLPAVPGVCSTSDSPLFEQWYAEKLHMEHKNLIIILDNSYTISPYTIKVLKDALIQALDTLTPNDKVNIVTFDGKNGVEVPIGCQEDLFVATYTNINILKNQLQHITPVTGETKLFSSLQKAYELFEADTNTSSVARTRQNLILMLLQGESHLFPADMLSMLQMITKHQQMLVSKARHFIYMLGQPSDDDVTKLMQVADQNNLKLKYLNGTTISAWPQILQPVGPEGVLTVVEDENMFAGTVGLYFQHIPPSTNAEHDLTTIVPVLDKKYGLGLTVAAPVSDTNRIVGVVAVDASLATIFSDLVNLHIGVNSYSYLVDNNQGHVLLHPKLRDPSETWNSENIFPRLELLEPHLTTEQRNMILQAESRSPRSFQAQVNDLHPEINGELVTSRNLTLSPVTIYCQRVAGTSLVAVLVVFKSDVEEPKFRRLVPKVSLHGIYHRIDKLLGAPGLPTKDAFCHLYGDHFLSFKQSVIKFAPDVFIDSEVYKYSDESVDMASQLNLFITSGATTKYIKSSMQDLLLHTLEATDTLDTLWTNHSKDVIERFYGSSDGVFRIYPGSPMMSTFDHRGTDWYKRSTAFPGKTMYHLGRLGFLQQGDVIIISKAVTSQIGVRRLQGVVGITVTPRFLTSQLIAATSICTDQLCHILDTSGQILDSLGTTSTGLHITKLYPWLAQKLITAGTLQQEWCTGFSDGYHKMTFTLTQNVTSDLDNSDPCLQYSLHDVTGTNLFILVLEDRDKLQCDDQAKQICTSCQTPVDQSDIFTPSLPECQYCLDNMTSSTCQCPCYCHTDLDQCHGQFRTDLNNFPSTNCFYAPSFSTEFIPESPGPMHHLDRCPIPCVAIEDLDICSQLEHCKISVGTYPTCIWKNEEQLKNISDISHFFPTTSPSHPPTLPPHTPATSPRPETSPGLIETGTSPSVVTSPIISTSTGITSTNSPRTSQIIHSTQAMTGSTSKLTETSTLSYTTPELTGSTPKWTDTSKTIKTGITIITTIPPLTDSSQDQSTLPTEGTSNVPQVTSQSATQEPGFTSNIPAHVTQQNFHHSTEKLTNKSEHQSEPGMSRGAIAALVIGILVLIVIVVVVGLKIYSKKFRRQGTNAPSAKYRAGSTLFDSSVFLRNVDQAPSNTSASSSTNVPYQEM